MVPSYTIKYGVRVSKKVRIQLETNTSWNRPRYLHCLLTGVSFSILLPKKCVLIFCQTYAILLYYF